MRIWAREREFCSRDHIDADESGVGRMKDPTAGERRPLDDEGADEKVERDAAEAVSFEEGHQKAEPDEHHHVYVLEHCRT